MYAAVGSFEMSASPRREHHEGADQIASRVALMPGFVSGYWSESHSGSLGHTYVVFELRQQADDYVQSLLADASDGSVGGATVVSVTLAEVTASAIGQARLPRVPRV